MKQIETNTQKVSAARTGMDVKTARKYLKAKRLPSELTKAHDWKTHDDAFAEHWGEIEAHLEAAPGLEAKTLFDDLVRRYPERYREGQLRTLQRRVQAWRAQHGEEKPVIFRQVHVPGRQSQSDFTQTKGLGITIGGRPYPHLLFHFMLVYSRWEDVMICKGESFESLLAGYEQAVWRLGGVTQEHRTDNLTAAMKPPANRKEFTERWLAVMKHYEQQPTTNNAGVSHENGSIEKGHDLLKKAVEQHLLLRGSRDFESLEAYQGFLEGLLKRRNRCRAEKLQEERRHLKGLPEDRWYTPKVVPVRVSPASVVNIAGVAYSVPSRLISYSLNAHCYPQQIKLYYGHQCLQIMPRLEGGALIDYRHVIDSLVRKPGAFKHYQYQASLFPNPIFRRAYDRLEAGLPARGFKEYLQALQLAKHHGERPIQAALELLEETSQLPTHDAVREVLKIRQRVPRVHVDLPFLGVYDGLLMQEGAR